ncbi:lysostaphin resistance A-like protein [Actinomadura sp. 21ATH]|uniref:CPBP family intramembrane glutamic endopeptidase n=1 Tax=Actinomadura sp. 21ATH TaxID=1735444 RepID=UPI0035C26ED1
MSDPADNGWAPPDPGRDPSRERPERHEGLERPGSDPAPEPPAPQGWPDPGQYGQAPQPYAQAPQAQQYPQPQQYPQAQPQPYSYQYGQPYGAQQPYGQPQPEPYGAAPFVPGYGYTPPAKRPWTVPPRPGAKYHHMARTDVHRWWRPLVGSLVIVAAGMALVMAAGIVAMVVAALVAGEFPTEAGEGGTILGDQVADLALNLAALGLFLPIVLLVPWWIQRRRPGTLSSVAGRLRWRWLLACAGVAVLFCVVSFGLSLLASTSVDEPVVEDENFVGWGRFLLAAAVILALVPFQASAEEYVFRGWLLQGIGACTLENARSRVGQAFGRVFRTPWPGIAAGSAVFMSLHGYTGFGMLDVFLFGAAAGWLTVRTGGLEAAIALHVLNNIMAFMFPAAVGELTIEQGAVAWQYVAADVVSMALYAAAVAWLARRLRVRTTVADPAAAAVPAGAAPADAVDAPPGTPPFSAGQEAAER